MATRRSYAGGAVATTITSSITSTSLTVAIADATGWPNTASGECYVTLGRGTASEERALCTRSGTTLTFASTAKRGVDGTTATSHASGSPIEHTFSAADADEANDHVTTTGAVHTGASLSPGTLIVPSSAAPAQTADASVVWDSDDDVLTVGTGAGRKTQVNTDSAQTLTNKTVALGSNTVSGTTAQFNAANTDGDFATLAGAETLTNKTLTTPTLSVPVIADFTSAQHTHASAAQGGSVSAAGAGGYAGGGTNNTPVNITATSAATATAITGLSDVSFTAVTGRRYKVSITLSNCIVPGANALRVSLRDGGASAPTTSSTLLQHNSWGSDTSGVDQTLGYHAIFTGLSAGTHRLGLFSYVSGGSGTVGASTAGAVSYLTIEDIGT